MSNIRFRAGDNVVEGENVPSLRDQAIAEMRTQETRTTGNYCTHASSREMPTGNVIAAGSDLTTRVDRDTMRALAHAQQRRRTAGPEAPPDPGDSSNLGCWGNRLHCGHFSWRGSVAGCGRSAGQGPSDCGP